MDLIDIFKPAKPISPIEDKAQVDRLFRKYRLSIIIAITLGYSFYYICRLGLAVVKKPMLDAGFTPQQLGQIGSTLFYGYAFGKLFNGFLADHVNVRKMFAVGLLLSALCNFIFGFSNYIWLFILVWAINGWVQSFGAACCCISLSNWYTYRERGFYYGIWSGSHCIGEGLVFFLGSIVVTWFGWRFGFLVPAVVCSLSTFVFYLMMQDRPASCGLPKVGDWENVHGQKTEPASVSTFAAQLEIFKSPVIWLIALASAGMYVSRYAVNSWGMLYLQEEKGFTAITAGSLQGIREIVALAGGLVYGIMSDRMFKGRRPPATLIFGILEILSLIVIFMTPVKNYYVLAGAFSVFGFAIAGLLIGVGGLLAIDVASKKAAGAAIGFVGIFSYIAAAMQENISGYLIQKGSTVVNGVTHYDFSKAVLFWIGASVVSLLLACMTWNAKVKE